MATVKKEDFYKNNPYKQRMNILIEVPDLKALESIEKEKGIPVRNAISMGIKLAIEFYKKG